MRAPISIIVPTLNAAPALQGLAASLIEGLDAGLIAQMIISDGGSEDETLAVAEAIGASVISGPRGRGRQLQRGVQAALAPWLLLLHADTVLAPGWAAPVRRHIETGPGRAAVFQLAFRAEGARARQTAAWANWRTRGFGLPYGDQGLLIHRDTLAAIGGVPEIDLMEDVALARALKWRIDVLDAVATTDAARYLRNGWTRQGAANLWRLTRYLAGANPDQLAQGYRRR